MQQSQIICLVCYFLSSIVYGSLVWSTSTTPLPRADIRMAPAYSKRTNLIWLIGGWYYKKQLVSFDPIQIILNSPSPYINNSQNTLPQQTYVTTQGRTQIEDILYMIHQTDGNKFSIFNLSSESITYNYNSISFPQKAVDSCLAHIDNYLIITGGQDSGSNELPDVQIYDLTSKSWITSANDMTSARRYHTCVVNPNTKFLYVIGGTGSGGLLDVLNSVSKLYVGDMININLYNWTNLQNTLREPKLSLSAVFYNDDIFVIGGYAATAPNSGSYYSSDYVERISSNDIISPDTDLPEAVAYQTCIVVNNTLFVLGGRDSTSSQTNLIQYSILDQTGAPSDNPTTTNPTTSTPTTSTPTTTNPTTTNPTTTNPTTSSPTTSNPTTSNPTAQPTPAPTSVPTPAPTAIPTPAPTTFPTKYPTTFPSKYPTAFPTKYPTTFPSKYPTTFPSKYPTTPKPTSPDELFCADQHLGTYSGDEQIFNVQVLFHASVTFDATNSTFDFEQVTITAQTALGVQLGSDETDGNDNGILTIPNLPPDDYKFIISGLQTGVNYNVKIICVSKNPTSTPTSDPTLAPTQQPTLVSKNPILIPTKSPTTHLADGVSYVEEGVFDGVDTTYYVLSSIVLSVFTIIGITGYIDAAYYRINDFFSISAIFSVMLHVFDLISDVFLGIKMSERIDGSVYKVLFSLSLIFIVIPIGISIIQLWQQINKHWSNNDKIKLWLSVNVTMLYLLSFFTGSSFTAVELLNTNLYLLPTTSMDLSHEQLTRFLGKRTYSIVLFENIPQVVIQFIYLIHNNELNGIAISSMIFSIISILITIISIKTKKQIMDSQGYAIVNFNVTGSAIISKTQGCRNQVKKLKNQLSSLLGLDTQLVEVMRPQKIPNGLKMTILIHVNRISVRDIDYKKIFNDAQQNGQLKKIVMNAWDVEQDFICVAISFQIKESKQWIAGIVPIKVQSVSSNNELNHHIQNNQIKEEIEGFNGNLANIQLAPIPQVHTETAGKMDGEIDESDELSDGQVVNVIGHSSTTKGGAHK